MIKFIQYIKKSLTFTYELYILRQQLNSSPEFILYDIFKSIDINTNGYITKSDIQKYFKFDSNSLIPQLLVKLMSTDKKNSVKYMDFYHFLKIQVPKSNINNNHVSMEQKKRKIKVLIKEIFMKEVEFLSATIQTKMRLQLYTFNEIYVLFTKLDHKKLQMIDESNFATYLKKYHNEDISQQVLNIFLKREFKSNTITFCQFYEFFQNSKRVKKLEGILKNKLFQINMTPKKKQRIVITSDFESTMKKLKKNQKNKNNRSRSLLKKQKNMKINQTQKQISKYHNTLISYLGKVQASKQIKQIKKSCSRYLKYKY